MKRGLLILLLFAALAASTAPADAQSPTCGGSAVAEEITHSGPPTHWTIYWDQNCGDGKTIEWQIQESTNGGPWTADTTRFHITTTDEANHWVYSLQGNDTSFTCSNLKDYRLRVTWADGYSNSAFSGGTC